MESVVSILGLNSSFLGPAEMMVRPKVIVDWHDGNTLFLRLGQCPPLNLLSLEFVVPGIVHLWVFFHVVGSGILPVFNNSTPRCDLHPFWSFLSSVHQLFANLTQRSTYFERTGPCIRLTGLCSSLATETRSDVTPWPLIS